MPLDSLVRSLPNEIAQYERLYRAEPGGSTLAEVYRVTRNQLIWTLWSAQMEDHYDVLLADLHQRLAAKRTELTRVFGREPHLAAMIEAEIEIVASLIVTAEELADAGDGGGGYLPIS